MLPLLLATALAAAPSLFLVAGHGTSTNHGNTGVHGQREAEVTLELALDLEARLGEALTVHQGRAAGELPSYDTRLARLVASGAPRMIELHTDSRPEHTYTWEGPDGPVLRNDEQPGFSVLYNASGPLADERRRLAVALAEAMRGAGLEPYTQGYGELYDAVPDAPGVYIDRRGLKMLRMPAVPSVIVETHHALDPEEVALWEKEETRAAFAEAVKAAVTGLHGEDGQLTP